MSLITFDWAQIAYIGSPLATPWWAEANIVAGFVFFFCKRSLLIFITLIGKSLIPFRVLDAHSPFHQHMEQQVHAVSHAAYLAIMKISSSAIYSASPPAAPSTTKARSTTSPKSSTPTRPSTKKSTRTTARCSSQRPSLSPTVFLSPPSPPPSRMPSSTSANKSGLRLVAPCTNNLTFTLV